MNRRDLFRSAIGLAAGAAAAKMVGAPEPEQPVIWGESRFTEKQGVVGWSTEERSGALVKGKPGVRLVITSLSVTCFRGTLTLTDSLGMVLLQWRHLPGSVMGHYESPMALMLEECHGLHVRKSRGAQGRVRVTYSTLTARIGAQPGHAFAPDGRSGIA